jgi:glyoxylase-like metal-dependent hydrolase (beta-lactamase superfamily II)
MSAARATSAPERLIASARQVYGERLATLFGGMRPVPARAIGTVGERDRVGPFDVIHTPGHAGHHVVYSHRDRRGLRRAGVRIPPAELVLVRPWRRPMHWVP